MWHSKPANPNRPRQQNRPSRSRDLKAEADGSLASRLRRELTARARCGTPVTYRSLAGVLPPARREASRLRDILEQLMEEDAREGRPLIAALAVDACGNGLPASWFFSKAEILGRFAGDPRDVEAFAFHARERHRSIIDSRARTVPR